MFSTGVFALAAVIGYSAPISVTLAKGGEARAEIVIGEKATMVSQFAAAEIKAHLDAIVGGNFSIVRGQHTVGRPAIYVGPESLPDGLAKTVGFSQMGEQEHLIAFEKNAIILVGHDSPLVRKPTISYCGTRTLETRPFSGNWPNIWTERGTMNAAYDFLRDDCGVEWLDPYESGTVFKKSPNLIVNGVTRRGRPFCRCRDASSFYFGLGADGCLWEQKLHPEAWTNFYRAAFPETFARTKTDPFGGIRMQEALFALRMKLGGERISANHSFYWWYDRFLDKQNPRFVAYHPEYFSKHLARRKAGRAENGIFAEYDTAKRPTQLCYSSPEVLKQTIIDVRAYFDAGGYTNRYTGQGVACNAKQPAPVWGKNVYCLEPMDGGCFCECEECRRQYDDSRNAEHASRSDYWFRFVNNVAKEIKKSHPGKYVSTLAYGIGREGLPTFRLEDNVVVHFCWEANRGPNRQPHESVQEGLMRKWREAYPKNEFGLWLYNTFPYEIMHRSHHCNAFPGFFGKMLTQEYRFIRDLNMREAIFNCGWKDDFENYLSARYMWNPSEKYDRLKDNYFSAYGPAEKSIRAFYDLVESRFCNTSNYVHANGKYLDTHMTRDIAWGCLGTMAVMDELESLMADAEECVRRNGTAQHRSRVELWRKGVWDYMIAGCTRRRELPTGGGQVKLVRTDYLARTPKPLAKNLLLNHPLYTLRCMDGKKEALGKKGDNAFGQFTDGKYTTRNITFPYLKGSELVHFAKLSVKNLTHFRVCLQMDDGLRYEAHFRPVGLVGGKWTDLGPRVDHDEYCKGFNYSGHISVTAYDYEFAPGSVPQLEGIGFATECVGRHYPGYCQIEAE